MARKEGPSIVVDVGVPADTRVTENEWQWIRVLRIICNGHVPAPSFPATMSMQDLFGSKEEEGH